MDTTEVIASEAGGDSFRYLLLAEWTKLRSVPRWRLTLVAAVGLIILVSLLGAESTSSMSVKAESGDAGEVAPGGSGEVGPAGPAGPASEGDGGAEVDWGCDAQARCVQAPESSDVDDHFYFVHQPLTGDGSIVARVVTQEDSEEWARAGVMLKQRLEWEAPYAALAVTPDHGVRLKSEFTDDDVAGSDSSAPRWLRLARSGDSVTGYESADGSDWNEVGTVELDELPRTVEVGLFVNSPSEVRIERDFGGESIGEASTVGEATFDNVTIGVAGTTTTPPEQAWSHYNASLDWMGSSSEAAGVFTVRGSGDIGEEENLLHRDDLVQSSLAGVFVGLLAIVALGVLFVTSEYKRGMIRTTLAASPRRGRVLAAKAVVLGGVTFVAGLVATVTSFLVTQPILRSNGYGPPEYPEHSLADPTVLRAVVGAAALLALVAVLGLAAGTIMRRSAGPITLVIVLMVLPGMVGTGLPLAAAKWLTRLTPSAGLAILETVERYDTEIGPIAGFGVLCVYAAATLAVAAWLLERRDV